MVRPDSENDDFLLQCSAFALHRRGCGEDYHNFVIQAVLQLYTYFSITNWSLGVVAQWCNPLTWKPEQSGGVRSRRDRASPLKHHDKGSRTRLALSYFCDPSTWR